MYNLLNHEEDDLQSVKAKNDLLNNFVIHHSDFTVK